MTELKDKSEKEEKEMSDNLRITLVALGGFMVLICCVIFERGNEKNAAAVETADTSDLCSGTQRECVGSSSVNGINKGGYVMKNVKHYENEQGQVILAYEGLSRPYVENEPFIEGFWVLTDKYGSEQFIPKPEFIKIYREIKLPK